MTTERLIEIEETWGDPYTADTGDDWEALGIEFDDTHCPRGRHCAGATPLRSLTDFGRGIRGALVGPYLEEPAEYGDRGGGFWRTCWRFESLPGKVFCEDCAYELSSGRCLGTDLPWLEEDVHGMVASVFLVDDDGFLGHAATFAPDHGMSWEREFGPHPTIGAAWTEVHTFAVEVTKEIT